MCQSTLIQKVPIIIWGNRYMLQLSLCLSRLNKIWNTLKRATVPLIIGFILTSTLTIYAPRHTISSWLGEGAWQGPYLAALLTIPLQLTSGAEVLLASTLSIKEASLGTVLSVMLVAPSTTFSVIHHLNQPVQARTTALYIVSI